MPNKVFKPALAVLYAMIVQVSGIRALTAAGVRAKARVCQAVLAMNKPGATTAQIGEMTRRYDALAWSTLSDLAKMAGAPV